MNKYYDVQIRITVDTEKGPKSITEVYLVYAVSVTDAEVKINKDFQEFPNDWEIKAIKETKIQKVID